MSLKSCLQLPEEYAPLLSIDLQKERKLALLVNGLALLIMAAMIVPALLLHPLSFSFGVGETDGSNVSMIWVFLILFGGIIGYMVLHELVHGIFMRLYSGTRPRYGFTGLYAFAASDAYFGKRPYLVIGLSPVVIWGVVLLVLQLVLPEQWFWPVYLIQMANLSGAAGDLYVTWKLSRLPKDILIRDTGVAMTVYAPNASTAEPAGEAL